MLAAVAFPAPIVCIKVGAVKKIVVESVCHSVVSPLAVNNWNYVIRRIGGLISLRAVQLIPHRGALH